MLLKCYGFSSVDSGFSHELNASDGTRIGLRTSLKWAPERDYVGARTVTETLMSAGSGPAQDRSRGSVSARFELMALPLLRLGSKPTRADDISSGADYVSNS